MYKIILFFILFFHFTSYSQSISKQFFNLSTAEKCWVIFHPFKTSKAYKITNETLRITDSISNNNTIGNDINGGHLDAFKHSYWMANLCRQIGEKAALKLGKAHEKGNYQTFKKNKKEDGFVPDKPSTDMDLYNNIIGAKITSANPNSFQNHLIKIIIENIKNGEMKILKKDASGNFLTCDGALIPIESLKGKWENEKCLIFSNIK